MKPQEVVTVISRIPTQDLGQPIIRTYPELDAFFEKGMYIEDVQQILISQDTYITTFIFRHYNQAQSNN